MNMRTVNWKRSFIYYVGLAIFIGALSIGMCIMMTPSSGSSIRKAYVGNETKYLWSGKYKYFGGNRWKTLNVKNGMLTVEVETVSGTISIEMFDMDGNEIFKEDDIQTTQYEIEAPDKVKVHIVADAHQGRFKIRN